MAISEAESLAQIPLFSNLSSLQLRKLQRGVTEHRYEADTTIVREGGRTTTLFVVIDGTAKVGRKVLMSEPAASRALLRSLATRLRGE
ncbi:MAG TPA: cyclic nucleotide-binding domain-containing protein [Actinomycetota bacterium]|nr:cyclic nucleotide-binding domain-containing protein [Actinomycetota bacterium]